MNETEKRPRRTPEMILLDIQAALASVDGISTADAFRIGTLVREYGTATSGVTSSEMLAPLLDVLQKDSGGKREPWRGGPQSP